MTRRRPGARSRSFPRSLVVLAVLAVAVLGACSSSKTSGPTKTVTGGAITVTATEFKFDVGVIKTAPGSLTVTLVNNGAIEHTFKIDSTSLLLKAKAGKSVSGSVTLAKGTYKFECTIPGHAQQGMKGTVDVS